MNKRDAKQWFQKPTRSVGVGFESGMVGGVGVVSVGAAIFFCALLYISMRLPLVAWPKISCEMGAWGECGNECWMRLWMCANVMYTGGVRWKLKKVVDDKRGCESVGGKSAFEATEFWVIFCVWAFKRIYVAGQKSEKSEDIEEKGGVMMLNKALNVDGKRDGAADAEWRILMIFLVKRQCWFRWWYWIEEWKYTQILY